MSKLNEILQKLEWIARRQEGLITEDTEWAKQQIKELMLELIGDDWPLDEDLPPQQEHNRQVLNGQLYELRQKVEAL